jgi:hypothetical protein
MDNARAAFSSIDATTGSSIFNNGILLAESITLHESTMENREGASILLGYDFREIKSFRNSNLDRIMSDLTSRLQANVGCLNQKMYSSIHNDGKIVYSTDRMAATHDSVKESGSGSYARTRGKNSRYMLTS